MCGEDVLTFVAYRSNNHYIAPRTPKGVLQVGSQWTRGPSGGCKDAALFGAVITPEVARVELVTLIGDVEPRPLEVLEVPMHIVQLPASLGTGKRYVWTLVNGYGEYIREVREGLDDTDDDAPAVGTYIAGYDRNGYRIVPSDPFGAGTRPVSPAAT